MTATPHSARAHATLAPSAAHRWIECAGSIRMEADFPNTTSVYAAEGSAAHELAGWCLANDEQPEDHIELWIDLHSTNGNIFVAEPPEDAEENRYFEITEDMVEAVTVYTDHVRALLKGAKDSELEVEQRLDMTHLHPEIYGTGDATVYIESQAHLHVCDYKHGKGHAVDADENPQLLLYGVGAAMRHHNRPLEKITLHIIQPRAAHPKGPIRSFELDIFGLFEFEDVIKAAALATDAGDAPLKAGDWCRFCRAQAVCPAARQNSLTNAAAEFGEIGDPVSVTAPEKLTPEQLAAVLKEADTIGNWLKSVQEFAHSEACNGRMPVGYKLVAKRAIRKWKDEDAVKAELDMLGVDQAEAFTEPKLKSPAQLEKHWPGSNKEKRQAAMGDLVVKNSSGTNLAPLSDPRPAVKADAATDFGTAE